MDRVGRHLSALERQEHAGGEDRVEEREGVAGQAEAVAADRLGAVAELAGHPHRLDARAATQVVGDPDAVVRLAREDRLGVARVAVQVVRLGDDADADDVVGQGDVPEPALLGDVGDRGRALVESGVALRAAVVREDGELREVGVAPLPAEFRGEERVAAGGVDDRVGVERAGSAAGGVRPDPHRAAAVQQQLAHRRPLPHVGALRPRVVEQHAVEVAAQHLPRRRAGMIDRLEEVERLRHLAARRHELHAVLLRARRLREPVEHPEPLEREPRVRHQRLADVVAGKRLALEDRHAPAVLRQHGPGGGAGRAAADDDAVVPGAGVHRAHRNTSGRTSTMSPIRAPLRSTSVRRP